ncbi:hypothetical protein B0H66DRAFT_199755 [Apodospora peruviana]|uniref:BHLH domain-containing protein n=1 Tax=Apodospora peruviana TaxID=516989 RepID=A0AAE0ICB3_9PEZI|nr:hypothetical protein B0H66DRAFT_199755 [Apodospora peruviana]
METWRGHEVGSLLTSRKQQLFGPSSDLDRLSGRQHATPSNNQPTTSTRVPVPSQRNIPAFSNHLPYNDIRISPIFTGAATTYPTRVAVDPTPTSPAFYQTSLEWQQSPPASDLLYTSEPSSAVSTSSNPNLFEYVSQTNAARDPYMGDYVPSAASQDDALPNSRSLYWGSELTIDNNIEPSLAATTTTTTTDLASPILPAYESPLSGTPEGTFSDYSDGATYGGDLEDTSHHRKRAKQSAEQEIRILPLDVSSSSSSYGMLPLAPAPVPPAVKSVRRDSSGTGNTQHRKQLRSASRTSKNSLLRPTESTEERKTRNSHNLVEKQYRNRLNAQFESLLNALPDTRRSSTSTGVGGDSDGGSGSAGPGAAAAAAADLGEKRLSKAEVLDMSRRYIQTLESERDKLKQDQEELLGVIDKLQVLYAKGGGGGGGSGGGSSDVGG